MAGLSLQLVRPSRLRRRAVRHEQRRWIKPFLPLLLLGAFALTPLIALAQELNTPIEILQASARLGSSRVGVYIQSVDTGEALAAINETSSFLPASNMKLLTTGAALAVLGPDFIFRTELRRFGDTLLVVGSGDPALGDPDLLADMGLGVEDMLGRWVSAVRRSGPAPPTKLIIDARVFDRELVHPTWPADQLNRAYEAEVAGLNFYTNVVGIYLAKRAKSEPPRITLEPAAAWLRIQNEAKSVDRGQNTVWVARSASSNNMTVYGDLRQSMQAPIRVAIHDPPAFFGRLLATRLEAAGLGRMAVRLAKADEELDSGDLIALVQTPLPTALRRCNVDSQNLYAEALLKRIGHEVTGRPGSFSGGAAVVRMVMQDILGPQDTARAVIADGSGLSRDNRLPPRTMGRWLRALANDPALAKPFVASLPIAGEEGTLAERFRQTGLQNEVRAKSGYIRGVSCLSGYITDRQSGERLAFSILVNDIPQQKVPIARVKEFHEAVVRVADGWLVDHRAAIANVGQSDGPNR